uniref:Uncharacterized protein n=1 Tax=Meloidogyne javanica TaxID=6303 RepID=A0A915M866_MELJA
MQVIDTIAKQYDNLLSANNELNNEFMNSCTRVQNNPMGNHEMEQKIDAETNQLNAPDRKRRRAEINRRYRQRQRDLSAGNRESGSNN